MTGTKRKKAVGLDTKKSRIGYYFLLPWIFGVLVFVVGPMFSSIYYSFSNVSITANGITPSFAGLKWYKYALIEDPDFIDIAVSSLSSFITALPIILSVSLLLALILNQPFKGRMFARSVFFLPVIISSGVIMEVLSGFTMSDELSNAVSGANTQVASYMQVIDFNEILVKLNLPDSINGLMVNYLSDLFNLIWSCGIQILLFIAGLQTIPTQLYEVSKVEGATSWEEFWFITVPMLRQTILLVGFYTMIELFVEKSELVIKAIGYLKEQVYDRSSAMLWLYFIAVGLVMCIVVLIYKKCCLDKWE